jgi:ketosteroid isomerase-like protein
VTPEETMRAYEAAARDHDLDALLPLVADEAVYWFSNESSHVGKPAVERAIRSNFESFHAETYEIDQLRWLCQTEDVAVCVYRFRWTAVIEGQPAAGSGRGTNVLRREDDRWLLVHEHLSRGPAT